MARSDTSDIDSGLSCSNIPFVSKTVRGKSSGDDMETYSGYTSRSDGTSERTGSRYRFSARRDLLHHEVLYPRDATPFADAQAMWQAVNVVERHPNAQFAYEVVLPLTADPTVGLDHHIAMVRRFAEWYRVDHGVPVQIDIHDGSSSIAGDDEDPDEPTGTPANPHAHLLMPTRVLDRDGFGDKTRHLNPPFFRGRVMEEERLRQVWAEIQRRYGEEHGFTIRTEPTGFVSQPHLGPLSCRAGRPELMARLALARRANIDAACDPAEVLLKLTEHNASFTDDDLESLLRKHLGKQVDAATKIAVARADVLASADLIALNDKESHDWSGRYSTRQVREQEQDAIDAAAALAAQSDAAVRPGAIHAALARHPLLVNEPDQRAAFDYVVAPGKVKLIEGRAGTGKSYTLAAIREAFEDADEWGDPRQRVIGLSHMHVVKEGMKADGFAEAYTVTRMLSLLHKSNGAIWDGVAMVAVDEAAMLSTAQLAGWPATAEGPAMHGLLYWAEQTGTKIVLVGDDRQLPSIDRGGLFTELVERHGSRVLTKVRRQRADWQRDAAEDLANYDFEKAVRAFDTDRTHPSGEPDPRRIAWCDGQAQAIRALADAWRADSEMAQDGAPDPTERQFAFAFKHSEVDVLNKILRQIQRDRGETGPYGLKGPDVLLDVCYKEPKWGEEEDIRHDVPFAVGDRIQFTRNDEAKGIFNGNFATITEIRPAHDAAGSWNLTATVDTAFGKTTVRWNSDTANPDGFNGVRHGYAGTAWKGQGKTIDRTYNLFSERWAAPVSYMLLTRQRDDAKLFVASPNGARDPAWLAEKMARRTITSASLAWDEGSPNTTGDGRDAEDHLLEVVEQQLHKATASSSDADTPEVAIDLVVGRAQFRQKLAERQKARTKLGHDVVADWDKRFAAYTASLAGRSADTPTQVPAHERLAGFARTLAAHDWLPAMIRADPVGFGLADRPELSRVVASEDAGQAIALLMARMEQARPERDALDRWRRPRDRGPEGR